MKILIAQPIHENGTEQLEKELRANKEIDIVLFPEGYLSSEQALREACSLAKIYNIAIITSYRKDNKDRAVIISETGQIIYERAKTLPGEAIELNEPLTVDYHGNGIGYVLCMEVLKGVRDLKKVRQGLNFVAHPIGVGMFSEEQFEEWIGEAKKIAKTYNTMILGTSHADGSYKNCGVSIAIAYCIDADGDALFISKSDTRTRIVDLASNEVKVSL
jgi:predicted amidohydrolase